MCIRDRLDIGAELRFREDLGLQIDVPQRARAEGARGARDVECLVLSNRVRPLARLTPGGAELQEAERFGSGKPGLARRDPRARDAREGGPSVRRSKERASLAPDVEVEDVTVAILERAAGTIRQRVHVGGGRLDVLV